MNDTRVTDYNGNPLRVGDRVEAWRDGVRFTATVREFRPHQASDRHLQRITLIRDEDHAEVQRFSDQVVVIGEAAGKSEEAAR